jgi:phage baseplate assembly protein W
MAAVLRRDTLTALKQTPEYFSDFLLDFDVDRVKKDLVRNTNAEAIKASIVNLLLTNRGDRLFDMSIGSDIRALLFENFNAATEDVLADLIKTTISNYEPRAKVDDVFVASDDDSHLLTATIVFHIINRQDPITLEIILNRIR